MRKEGHRGSGGRKSPVGSRGKAPRSWRFCYWLPKFWCFKEKKLVKHPKKIIKIWSVESGGGGQAHRARPLNTPLFFLVNPVDSFFYRSTLCRARFGCAIVSRPFVFLSVCDVAVPWSYSFEFFKTNYRKISLGSSLPSDKAVLICSKDGDPTEIPGGIGVGLITRGIAWFPSDSMAFLFRINPPQLIF